ncbi:MAG: VWA domain-containing protein [Gammaproteobacteria bacterium]|nr:VWA domain-containing protein [Gammaproteobacteria bacterium]
MQKSISSSSLRVAIFAILTTSVLMACTPSQQQTQNDNKNLIKPQPVDTMVVNDKNREVKTVFVKSHKSKLDNNVSNQKINQQNIRLNPPARALDAIQSGSRMYAEQAILPMVSYAAKPMHQIRVPTESVNRENYNHFDDNHIMIVSESPVSTFSIDVDTGAYSNVRRMINAGNLPREDAVRVEELINYFSYDYPQPENSRTPFSVTTEIGVTPWNKNTRLLHIGIKGYDVAHDQLPASNLVFLIDVSGSMNSPKKLGLLKSALKLMSKKMRSQDKISIVVYAGASGVVLEPIAANQSAKISQALDALSAGGSTNGAAGIRSAYKLAEQAFIKGGINRVMLATDGDFNVGTVNFEALKDLIEEKRKTGISLTTLGFGTGNYNDHLMEQLADAGNGNYAYIDTLNEAQKVLVDEMSSTLNTIAKDVKIQLEFNPEVVAEYRLIGYENRTLNREDFNNDKVDAGEIGAGHTVTALYEITLADSEHRAMDPLRYSQQSNKRSSHSNELAHLRLRYKEPTGNKSKLIEQVINTSDIEIRLAKTSQRFRFSASVAGFGQLLRGGKHTGDFVFNDVLALARKSRGEDAYGYRGEFISIVNLTNSLSVLSTVQQEDVQASR